MNVRKLYSWFWTILYLYPLIIILFYLWGASKSGVSLDALFNAVNTNLPYYIHFNFMDSLKTWLINYFGGGSTFNTILLLSEWLVVITFVRIMFDTLLYLPKYCLNKVKGGFKE